MNNVTPLFPDQPLIIRKSQVDRPLRNEIAHILSDMYIAGQRGENLTAMDLLDEADFIIERILK